MIPCEDSIFINVKTITSDKVRTLEKLRIPVLIFGNISKY